MRQSFAETGRTPVRRSLTTLRSLDPSSTLSDLPVELVEHTLRHFRQDGEIRPVLLDEERGFRRLVERGRDRVRRMRDRGPLTEQDFHYLHDTHGLPRDIVDSLLSE